MNLYILMFRRSPQMLREYCELTTKYLLKADIADICLNKRNYTCDFKGSTQ